MDTERLSRRKTDSEREKQRNELMRENERKGEETQGRKGNLGEGRKLDRQTEREIGETETEREREHERGQTLKREGEQERTRSREEGAESH